jgi:adenylate cyclase
MTRRANSVVHGHGCMLIRMQHIPEPSEIPESVVDQTPRTALSAEKQSMLEEQSELTSAPRVSGMDLEVGLRRAMGMNTFYRSMLQSFVETRRGSAVEIRSALKLQDLKKAELLSHSLFGLAAQIGATCVPYDAQALEQAISAGGPSDTMERLLAKLDISLSELIDGLEHYLLRMPESL